MTAIENRRGGANVRFPPPFVFLLFAGAGALLDMSGYPLPLAIGKTVRIAAAIGVLGAGLLLCGSTLTLFQRSGQDPEPWKPTPSLIAAGPYRFSRNPMYLGMLLIQAGAGLVFDNLWVVLLSLPALGVVHRIAVRPEERYLVHRFGKAYEDYMATVPRYVGRTRAVR